VTLDPPTILAPMAGITDRHYRRILRRIGGVGLVSMEFISSEGLHRGNDRTRRLMQFDPEEHPLAIQIYGSRPEPMIEAARLVEEMGADVCDINMGCPANKVLKGCAGAALMGDLRLAERIVAGVRRAISIPLTVKFRAGLREPDLNYVDLGRLCQDQGVAAVALHPRTAKQFFSGSADWDRIARLKEALDIPVIGNGDVQAPEDALEMMRRTGCDGVMIGRASMKNPWIFSQIRSLLRGERPVEPTAEQRRDLILQHFEMLRAGESETHALHKIRTFTGWYTHGIPGGRELRRRISDLRTVEEFLDAVRGAFAAARAA
jgi:nifR3 family TIM-barrel protein